MHAKLPAGYFLRFSLLDRLIKQCNVDRPIANTMLNTYEQMINDSTDELLEQLFKRIKHAEGLK